MRNGGHTDTPANFSKKGNPGGYLLIFPSPRWSPANNPTTNNPEQKHEERKKKTSNLQILKPCIWIWMTMTATWSGYLLQNCRFLWVGYGSWCPGGCDQQKEARWWGWAAALEGGGRVCDCFLFRVLDIIFAFYLFLSRWVHGGQIFLIKKYWTCCCLLS